MRILVTNDDGIHAEGLQVLERIARQLSDDVWVVAPETEQSGASRALTLSDPIRVRRLDERRFAVVGTPTDCVLLAVQDLIEGGAPDLVLSGVNRGQNIAEDVSLSGTVAAAIEGMALGIPSIALSQSMMYFHDEIKLSYETAEVFAPGIIARLLETGWPKSVLINIQTSRPGRRRPTSRSRSPARASATSICAMPKSGPTCAAATIIGWASRASCPSPLTARTCAPSMTAGYR